MINIDIAHHLLDVISEEVFTNYPDKLRIEYGDALSKAFVIFIDTNLN